MITAATPEQRQEIQDVAASTTEYRANPAVVNAIAEGFLAWAEYAADQDDLRARIRALRMQMCNTLRAERVAAGAEDFLVAARALYDFAATGARS